jgi:hypothetical protein
MSTRLLPALVALLALPQMGHSQSRADFSGDWTRVDSAAEQRSVASVGDAAFRTGVIGSGWASPLTISQQSGQLSIRYAFFARYDLQPPLTLSFALDGSESRNTVMIGHAASVLRSHLTWRDGSLVITTTYPAPPGVAGTPEVRQVLTLQSPTSLVVETTRSGIPGTEPAVTRTVWRRN